MMRALPFFRRGLGAGLLVLGCALYTSCSDNAPTQAGGGTYVENAIAGVIKTTDKEKAAGVQVSLYSRLYNPESRDTLQVKQTAVTGTNGAYEFQNIPKGEYQITAVEPITEQALLIPNIEIDSGDFLKSVNGTLKKPATLTVHIGELALTPQGYVYIPGTGISAAITQDVINRGLVTLSRIPTAAYSSLLYAERENTVEVNILPSEITLAPNAKEEVSRFAFWQDTARIAINTALDSNILDNVYDFPLLVRLTRFNFDFAGSSAGGDLRFAKSDGKTPLFHEIEHWDSAGRTAEVWVRLDTVLGYNDTQFIYMFSHPAQTPGLAFYKDPAAAHQVFSPELGYQSVLHLSDDPEGPAPQFADAAGVNPGILIDTATGIGFTAPGISHMSSYLTGNGQYITTSRVYYNPQSFSVSLWFKTSDTTGASLASFSLSPTGPSAMSDRNLYMDEQGFLHFGIFPAVIPDSATSQDSAFISTDPEGIRLILTSVRSYNDSKWHFATVLLNSLGQSLYVDGQREAHAPYITEAREFSGFWRIGYEDISAWSPFPQDFFLKGYVDEFRVKYGTDDHNFVMLSYKTQMENPVAVTFK